MNKKINSTDKLRVAVIFGGQSAEHDVSIVTGIKSVILPLQELNKYEIIPIYIDIEGVWRTSEKFMSIDFFKKPYFRALVTSMPALSVGFGEQKLKLIDAKKNEILIDIVFPCLHGTNGEDGALMGLLQMAGVAFVGCNMESSVLCMNKLLAKKIARQDGINCGEFKGVKKVEFSQNPRSVRKDLSRVKFPLFIKPVHLGSSIGITRVQSEDEIVNALEVAFHFDNEVIVEPEVKNLIEVTVPVIGNEQPMVGMTEQPKANSEEFFDFETKYLKNHKKSAGGTGIHGYSNIPAKINEKLKNDCETIAAKVFKSLGCSGIARVDLLIDSETGIVQFNEINPLPGSLYAHNWHHRGLNEIELVDKLIELAIEAHSTKKRSVVNNSNFLAGQ